MAYNERGQNFKPCWFLSERGQKRQRVPTPLAKPWCKPIEAGKTFSPSLCKNYSEPNFFKAADRWKSTSLSARKKMAPALL
jgi:hypothetical protein